MHALAGALQGLQQKSVAQGGFQFGRLADFRVQAAHPYFKTGRTQDIAECQHILQIESIAGMVFRHNQHRFGLRAGTLHRILRRVCRQLDEIRVQIIKPAGKQVHINRCHFITGIADIHRAIKRRLVRAPLLAEPSLDFSLIKQNFPFKFF